MKLLSRVIILNALILSVFTAHASSLSPLQPVLSSEVYQRAINATPQEQGEAKKILMSLYSKAQGQAIYDDLQSSIIECGALLGIAGVVGYVASGEGFSFALYNALMNSAIRLWSAGKGLVVFRRDRGKDFLSSIETKVLERIFYYPDVVLRQLQEAGQVARTDPHSRSAAISRMQLLAELPLNAPIPTTKLNDLQTPETLWKTFNNHLAEAFADDSSNEGLEILASKLVGFVRDVHAGQSKLRYISISGPHGVGKTRITATLYRE